MWWKVENKKMKGLQELDDLDDLHMHLNEIIYLDI